MKNAKPVTTEQTKLTVDQVVSWIYDHLKLIGVAIGAIILSAAGMFFYIQAEQNSEAEATDALFSVEKKYQDLVSSIRKQTDLGNPMFQIPPTEAEKAEIRGKAEPILADWQTIIEINKSRKASWTHAIKLAGVHFDNKDYALAEKVLSSVDSEVIPSEPFFGLIKHGLGLAQLGQNKYDEAIKAFNSILGQKKQEFIFPSALYQKAMAQKSLGDIAGSSETLQKLRQDFPQSSVAEISQTQLFLLRAMSWNQEDKSK